MCFVFYWFALYFEVVQSLACVASVSVGFGSKERPRNGVFGILPARCNGARAKKRTVRVGEGQKRLLRRLFKA